MKAENVIILAMKNGGYYHRVEIMQGGESFQPTGTYHNAKDFIPFGPWVTVKSPMVNTPVFGSTKSESEIRFEAFTNSINAICEEAKKWGMYYVLVVIKRAGSRLEFQADYQFMICIGSDKPLKQKAATS